MKARPLLPLQPVLLAIVTLAPPAWGQGAWLGSSVVVAPDLYTGPLPEGDSDPAAADRLFGEAQSAAEAGGLSRAFALATEALHADPDHAGARRVLGYERYKEGWRTPYQAKQAERGFVWSAEFGWLRPEDLPRYTAGERRLGRRWVAAEADAAEHAAIDEGWVVRTDHFAVTTNHSLESGARLAAELEGLYQVWRQLFAGYAFEPAEVRGLFEGRRDARKPSRPMRVFYHRDKDGYVAHLKRRQPRIDQTLGIYFDDVREAHFFAPPAGADAETAALARATLYHEAAHQLFAEGSLGGGGPGRRGAGRDANFALVEGVAAYFEMLAPVEKAPRYTLCDPAQGRLPSAVARGPVTTTSELLAMGQSDLQRQPELAPLYAQAAGLVAMLRHGDKSATDSEALVRTLRVLYGGSADAEELPRQVGRSADDIDREYRAFLANLSQ